MILFFHLVSFALPFATDKCLNSHSRIIPKLVLIITYQWCHNRLLIILRAILLLQPQSLGDHYTLHIVRIQLRIALAPRAGPAGHDAAIPGAAVGAATGRRRTAGIMLNVSDLILQSNNFGPAIEPFLGIFQ